MGSAASTSTDVGRRIPEVAGEDAVSEVFEWELGEREERRREEGAAAEAAAEEAGSLLAPAFIASPDGEAGSEAE